PAAVVCVSNSRQALIAGSVIAICVLVLWRALEAHRFVKTSAGAEHDSRPLPASPSILPESSGSTDNQAVPPAIATLQMATDETAASVVREVERVTRPKRA